MIGAVALAGLGAVAFGGGRLAGRAAERAYPPLGRFVEVGPRRVHVIDLEGTEPSAPVLVFVHGASGNGRDPLLAFGDHFQRHRRLFVDRPGQGWSTRLGRGDAAPDVQAAVLAGLLDRLGIDRAIVVGHSWGGAVTAAFGVGHGERTAGLVFLAPATHPWPGGIDGSYRLTMMPGIGRLFTDLAVAPVGRAMMGRALQGVFAPDPVPEGYARAIGAELVLRAAAFRANAEDVHDLLGHVRRLSTRYGEIAAPTLIVTGDRDPVVLREIHSAGLARDIVGARLVTLAGIGHMPHHAARERVVAEIEALIRLVETAAPRGTAARSSSDHSSSDH